jgi:hypothetical protein
VVVEPFVVLLFVPGVRIAAVVDMADLVEERNIVTVLVKTVGAVLVILPDVFD